jgi:hypothetical protein
MLRLQMGVGLGGANYEPTTQEQEKQLWVSSIIKYACSTFNQYSDSLAIIQTGEK